MHSSCQLDCNSIEELLKKEEIKTKSWSFKLAGGVDTYRVCQLGGKRRCFIDHQGVSTRRSGPRPSAKEAPSSAPFCVGGEPQVPGCLKQSGFTPADRCRCVFGLNNGQGGPSDRCRVRPAVRKPRVGPPGGIHQHSPSVTTKRLTTRADCRVNHHESLKAVAM